MQDLQSIMWYPVPDLFAQQNLAIFLSLKGLLWQRTVTLAGMALKGEEQRFEYSLFESRHKPLAPQRKKAVKASILSVRRIVECFFLGWDPENLLCYFSDEAGGSHVACLILILIGGPKKARV